MAITKEQLIERALADSEHPDDFPAIIAGMVRNKSGIGITARGEYNQRQWNALEQAKAKYQKPWD